MARRRTKAQPPPAADRSPARHAPNQIDYVRVERSGPLPPPSELAEYDAIVPDGAERIFRQWEGQTDHRQHLEKKVITSDIWRGWAGIGVAAFLDLVFFVASWDLVRSGHEWGGAALAVTATIHLSFGGISLLTVRQREANRQERREELERQRDR